jgi:hypothetical protein
VYPSHFVLFKYIVLYNIAQQMQSTTPSSGSSTERVDQDYTSTHKSAPTNSETWPITREVQVLRERNEANGGKPRKLGVTWKNLTVKGISNDAVFNENVLSQLNPFGKSGKNAPMKTIIDNSYGCVKPGGMLHLLNECETD